MSNYIPSWQSVDLAVRQVGPAAMGELARLAETGRPPAQHRPTLELFWLVEGGEATSKGRLALLDARVA